MNQKNVRTWAVTGALALGAAAGAAGIANAASGGNTQTQAPGDPVQNPAGMRHGPGETVLTGAAASKARAAARAAVPGATVIRVETDSAAAAYEAHLRTSDGTFVTVMLDRSFQVTGTRAGFGGPPQ